MIPKTMEQLLRDRLPERTWKNRLIRENGKVYMEFGPLDIDRLLRLGIEIDSLGPHLVVCMWDDESEEEIGGYLVVDNLAMGRPSMGGIRMLPDVTPAAIHNLARGMTLKNAAAVLPYGGGKSGIVASSPLSDDEHRRVVKGFARLLRRYTDIYLPGPDVGTNDDDMKTIAIENGLDNALSKPVDMGGNRIDQLGAAAGGVIIALEALLDELPRMNILTRFKDVAIPTGSEISVLIQGFGAVGAHAARILKDQIPDSRVIGISDASGSLYSQEGLPIDLLFNLWQDTGEVCHRYYTTHQDAFQAMKFTTSPNDLLREDAHCLIPAAPVANYLDVDTSTNPCTTVDKMGTWVLIIEGANTYSPDPARKASRARMEREVYRAGGTLIATDYLVNSGGVIFAAQEHLIKTPHHLRIPDELLGKREEVENWLKSHASDLDKLAQKRRLAAEKYRDTVIRRNMEELVDFLTADSDMLPCEAAEKISIRRIAASESDRSVSDVMAQIPTVHLSSDMRTCAERLIEAGCSILAVLSEDQDLAGVVTRWDITRAVGTGELGEMSVADIMTPDVISAAPDESLLEAIRKLEHHEISAMPVVEDGEVRGVISTDLLATRSLLRLLQSQVD